MAQILDGKALAKKIKEQVAAEAAALPRRPGLAVVLCVLSLNLLGDGLRDYLDPRTAGRKKNKRKE